MRLARASFPGSPSPVTVTVTADGTALDLGGRLLPFPAGGLAPAVEGWIYGPLLNESSTLDRFGGQLHDKPYVAPPTVPVLYFKPKNTHLGHGGKVHLPAYIDRVELGASVGMVFQYSIGRADPATAMDAIGGYTIVLDLSAPNPSIYRPPVREKCFDGACPVGPWITGRDQIADPAALIVRTYVNGHLEAERSFADIVRPPAQLITDVTEFMTLSKGDVLTLGHPVGAVPTAGRGDHIRIEIEGLGALECNIEESAA